MKLKCRVTAILDNSVAPRRGAWIETWHLHVYMRRERVAPRRGAWIETLPKKPKPGPVPSHPAGVRGLKHGTCTFTCAVSGSHPAGVRGLKRTMIEGLPWSSKVAPRRGAWIETTAVVVAPPGADSRTPQGCVD